MHKWVNVCKYSFVQAQCLQFLQSSLKMTSFWSKQSAFLDFLPSQSCCLPVRFYRDTFVITFFLLVFTNILFRGTYHNKPTLPFVSCIFVSLIFLHDFLPFYTISIFITKKSLNSIFLHLKIEIWSYQMLFKWNDLKFSSSHNLTLFFDYSFL